MDRSRTRWTAAAAALIAAAACSPAPPPGPPGTAPARTGTLRVLTYNVAGLPEGLSGSHPDVNTPLISPKLNPYDLVLVQEDWIDPDPPIGTFNFHHDDLVSAVTHPYRSVPATPPVGTDPRRPGALVADGLNLLSRSPIGESDHVMWDGCFGGLDTSDGGAGDCLALKGFTLTRLTLADGAEIDVYDLHGEAGGTATDQQLQADDFAKLAAHVTRRSAGRAVILAGDTNLHTDGRHADASGPADREIWRSFLAATGLTDVCDTLDCGTDADSIDKVAVRDGGGIHLAPTSHRSEGDTFVRPDGEPLSDHRPLAVTLDWSAPPR